MNFHLGFLWIFFQLFVNKTSSTFSHLVQRMDFSKQYKTVYNCNFQTIACTSCNLDPLQLNFKFWSQVNLKMSQTSCTYYMFHESLRMIYQLFYQTGISEDDCNAPHQSGKIFFRIKIRLDFLTFQKVDKSKYKRKFSAPIGCLSTKNLQLNVE